MDWVIGKSDQVFDFINNLVFTPQKNSRKLWKTIAAVFLILGFFGYLIWKSVGGVQQIIQSQIRPSFFYLSISVLFQVVGTALAVWVWGDILRKMGWISRFWFDFGVFCLSTLARKIPGGIWFALSRVTMYDQDQPGRPRMVLILAVVIEALTSVMGGVINVALSLMLGLGAYTWLKYKVLILVLIFIFIAFILYFSPFVIHAGEKRLRGNNLTQEELPPIRPWHIAGWIFAQAVVLIMATFVGYFLIMAINPKEIIPYPILLGSFNVGVILAPISMWLPGNAGLRDGIVFLAIQPYTSQELAAVFTLAWRVWTYLLEIALGVISGVFMFRRMRKYLTHD